jgi:hypothetical protein
LKSKQYNFIDIDTYIHVQAFMHNKHRLTGMHDIPENKENPLTSLGVKYLRHCSLSDVLSLFIGCTFN